MAAAALLCLEGGEEPLLQVFEGGAAGQRQQPRAARPPQVQLLLLAVERREVLDQRHAAEAVRVGMGHHELQEAAWRAPLLGPRPPVAPLTGEQEEPDGDGRPPVVPQLS